MGTEKSLVRLFYLLMLLAVLVSAKDIPKPPEGTPLIICGVKSKTWGGGLCVKHGTCNKPCIAEGFDAGYCGTFPDLHHCYCTRDCG